MRFSSGRLRPGWTYVCWLGLHEWVTWLDGTRPQDVAWGYSQRYCGGCPAREYAPGYPRE